MVQRLELLAGARSSQYVSAAESICLCVGAGLSPATVIDVLGQVG